MYICFTLLNAQIIHQNYIIIKTYWIYWVFPSVLRGRQKTILFFSKIKFDIVALKMIEGIFSLKYSNTPGNAIWDPLMQNCETSSIFSWLQKPWNMSMILKRLKFIRGGSRTVATSKVHKVLHLGYCSSPRLINDNSERIERICLR